MAEKKGILSQSRKWCLTINNPVEHGYPQDRIIDLINSFKSVTYWCLCDEIGGQEHTYHTHIYIYRKSPIKFKQLKDKFPVAHIEAAKGTHEENRDYCRKEGAYLGTEKETTNLRDTFQESGECPEEHQGSRTDLNDLYDYIKAGMSDYEILEINPNYMKRLDTIEKVRQTVKFEEFKHKIRELDVYYRYGPTGSGKSSGILNNFGFENVYRITDNQHPFDAYAGQDVIVFEEFYSNKWRLSDMLNYLDVYPLMLPCRYMNKQACYTKVYINSNIPLQDQYKEIQDRHPESWYALLRRITAVQIFDEKGSIKDYQNVKEYITGQTNKWMKLPEDGTLPWLPNEQLTLGL